MVFVTQVVPFASARIAVKPFRPAAVFLIALFFSLNSTAHAADKVVGVAQLPQSIIGNLALRITDSAPANFNLSLPTKRGLVSAVCSLAQNTPAGEGVQFLSEEKPIAEIEHYSCAVKSIKLRPKRNSKNKKPQIKKLHSKSFYVKFMVADGVFLGGSMKTTEFYQLKPAGDIKSTTNYSSASPALSVAVVAAFEKPTISPYFIATSYGDASILLRFYDYGPPKVADQHITSHILFRANSLKDAQAAQAGRLAWPYKPLLMGNITDFYDLRVTNGSTYYYCMKSCNGPDENANCSPYSNLSYVTAKAAAVKPAGLASNLQGTAIDGGTSIRLVWQDNSSNEDGFELDYSVGGSNWIPLAYLNPNVTTFVHEGLTPDTVYSYQVRSYVKRLPMDQTLPPFTPYILVKTKPSRVPTPRPTPVKCAAEESAYQAAKIEFDACMKSAACQADQAKLVALRVRLNEKADELTRCKQGATPIPTKIPVTPTPLPTLTPVPTRPIPPTITPTPIECGAEEAAYQAAKIEFDACMGSAVCQADQDRLVALRLKLKEKADLLTFCRQGITPTPTKIPSMTPTPTKSPTLSPTPIVPQTPTPVATRTIPTDPNFPWNNSINPLDVNLDNVVNDADTQVIIDILNGLPNAAGLKGGALPMRGGGNQPGPFVDTNKDNVLSGSDALKIINYLIAQRTPTPTPVPQFPTDPAYPWTNGLNPLDVDGKNGVTQADAQIIIDILNGLPNEAGLVPGRLPATGRGIPPFVDTNKDNSITPSDALRIINYLIATQTPMPG